VVGTTNTHRTTALIAKSTRGSVNPIRAAFPTQALARTRQTVAGLAHSFVSHSISVVFSASVQTSFARSSLRFVAEGQKYSSSLICTITNRAFAS
jgi:hypothetical protein